MPIFQRQHIRFSLDVPAFRCPKYGEKIEIALPQISIGGCLMDWDENIYTGEHFRLEIQLPNQNRLPLLCKVLYIFENNGIGVKFIDATKFEQDLIASTILHSLAESGLPLQVDPFAVPHAFDNKLHTQMSDPRCEREKLLEEIMSTDEEVYS